MCVCVCVCVITLCTLVRARVCLRIYRRCVETESNIITALRKTNQVSLDDERQTYLRCCPVHNSVPERELVDVGAVSATDHTHDRYTTAHTLVDHVMIALVQSCKPRKGMTRQAQR